MPFWPALWLEHHPTRDAYWKHGSICEDWGAVACPVLAIGRRVGCDSYTECRAASAREKPVVSHGSGIIGPWAHIYPQDGSPGPAIDFLGEADALVGPVAEGPGHRHYA